MEFHTKTGEWVRATVIAPTTDQAGRAKLDIKSHAEYHRIRPRDAFASANSAALPASSMGKGSHLATGTTARVEPELSAAEGAAHLLSAADVRKADDEELETELERELMEPTGEETAESRNATAAMDCHRATATSPPTGADRPPNEAAATSPHVGAERTPHGAAAPTPEARQDCAHHEPAAASPDANADQVAPESASIFTAPLSEMMAEASCVSAMEPGAQELYAAVIKIMHDAVALKFKPAELGFLPQSHDEWTVAGQPRVRDLFSLIAFFAKDGCPNGSYHMGAQLIDALGVKPAQPMPEQPGLGLVTVRELGIEATSFCLQPKVHAVIHGLQSILLGRPWDAGMPVLTVPAGVNAPSGPFQCRYIGAGGPNNVGFALSLATFVAAKWKSRKPSYEPPKALMEAASQVSAVFRPPPASFMEACVEANEKGLATYSASAATKPSLWDLYTQVRLSASAMVGGQGGFTIDQLLDRYYERNKGRRNMRFEENARWIVKKLLDEKQFPSASRDIMAMAQHVSSARLVEDAVLADAKSYAGSQTKKGTCPLSRMTSLPADGHTMLIKMLVQDKLEDIQDAPWLTTRNRIAIFLNAIGQGVFALVGVGTAVTEKWRECVQTERGRGHVNLAALDGLVSQCEKRIEREAISDGLEIKRVVADWLRSNCGWAKSEIAKAAAEEERAAKAESDRRLAREKAERLQYWKEHLPQELTQALRSKQDYEAHMRAHTDELSRARDTRDQQSREAVRRAAEWYKVHKVEGTEGDGEYVNVARAALSDIKARAAADAGTHRDADTPVCVRVIFIHDHCTRATGDEDHAKDVGVFLRECAGPADIVLFLNTGIATSQGKAATPLAHTQLTIESAIVGKEREVFQMDRFSIFRRMAGALSEHPRVDWTALRRVSKVLTRTPKHQTEHYAWALADSSDVWEGSRILSVGGLWDAPWPGLVWNCRKYVDQDQEPDEFQVEPQEQLDYVKIGYINQRDRKRFRGVDCCTLILKDLMEAASSKDPTSSFVVFDTAGSVGEWLAAGVTCSLQQGPDGTTLQPGRSGCFVACVEPQPRQYTILLDRRNAVLEKLVKKDGVAIDGRAIAPVAESNADLPSALKHSASCNRVCNFLKVSSDFSQLQVSLQQKAADLDISVDAELEQIFGSVRAHFDEPGTPAPAPARVSRRAAAPAPPPQPPKASSTAPPPQPPKASSTAPSPQPPVASSPALVKSEEVRGIGEHEAAGPGAGHDGPGARHGGSEDEDSEPSGSEQDENGDGSDDDAPLASSASRKRSRDGSEKETPAKKARQGGVPESPLKTAKRQRGPRKAGGTNQPAAAEADESGIETVACQSGFYSPVLDIAQTSTGQLVARLVNRSDPRLKLKMAGRADPKLLAYMKGQIMQTGCAGLASARCSFDFKVGTQDLVGFLPGGAIEPPSPREIDIQKFNDLYSGLVRDNLVTADKNSLLAHSIAGDAGKIKVTCLRSTKNVYKFVPATEDIGDMLARHQELLDYVRFCWVLRVVDQRLVPASLGLLNMKARVFNGITWVPITRVKEDGGNRGDVTDME